MVKKPVESNYPVGDKPMDNNYLKTIIGNNGGRYNLDILADLQKNLMNIELLIINELHDLFMGLY